MHYSDVTMTTMASQVTSLTVVYSFVYSDADQRKHQSSASLAFVWGIHRDRWIPRTKGQLRGKCSHLMTSSWFSHSLVLNIEEILLPLELQAREKVYSFPNLFSTNAGPAPCDVSLPWNLLLTHDDVIKWKHFPRYWPFVRGIHRSPVNSPHKGQWRGVLMFTLICARINDWVNTREAGDLRRNLAHYDVIVMRYSNTRLRLFPETFDILLDYIHRMPVIFACILYICYSGSEILSILPTTLYLPPTLYSMINTFDSTFCVIFLDVFHYNNVMWRENVSIWWRHHGIYVYITQSIETEKFVKRKTNKNGVSSLLSVPMHLYISL